MAPWDEASASVRYSGQRRDVWNILRTCTCWPLTLFNGVANSATSIYDETTDDVVATLTRPMRAAEREDVASVIK